jgi:hypothetical protein
LGKNLKSEERKRENTRKKKERRRWKVENKNLLNEQKADFQLSGFQKEKSM